MNGRTEVGLATAEAMGTELSDPALNLFVEDLWPQSDEAIVRGLTRRVVKFATRMASRRPLVLRTCLSAGVLTEAEVKDSECRAAWDIDISRHVVR